MDRPGHPRPAARLPVQRAAGRYEIAELDGHRPEDGELFLYGPDGLVQADPDDPNISIEEN